MLDLGWFFEFPADVTEEQNSIQDFSEENRNATTRPFRLRLENWNKATFLAMLESIIERATLPTLTTDNFNTTFTKAHLRALSATDQAHGSIMFPCGNILSSASAREHIGDAVSWDLWGSKKLLWDLYIATFNVFFVDHNIQHTNTATLNRQYPDPDYPYPSTPPYSGDATHNTFTDTYTIFGYTYAPQKQVNIEFNNVSIGDDDSRLLDYPHFTIAASPTSMTLWKIPQDEIQKYWSEVAPGQWVIKDRIICTRTKPVLRKDGYLFYDVTQAEDPEQNTDWLAGKEITNLAYILALDPSVTRQDVHPRGLSTYQKALTKTSYGSPSNIIYPQVTDQTQLNNIDYIFDWNRGWEYSRFNIPNFYDMFAGDTYSYLYHDKPVPFMLRDFQTERVMNEWKCPSSFAERSGGPEYISPRRVPFAMAVIQRMIKTMQFTAFEYVPHFCFVEKHFSRQIQYEIEHDTESDKWMLYPVVVHPESSGEWKYTSEIEPVLRGRNDAGSYYRSDATNNWSPVVHIYFNTIVPPVGGTPYGVTSIWKSEAQLNEFGAFSSDVDVAVDGQNAPEGYTLNKVIEAYPEEGSIVCAGYSNIDATIATDTTATLGVYPAASVISSGKINAIHSTLYDRIDIVNGTFRIGKEDEAVDNYETHIGHHTISRRGNAISATSLNDMLRERCDYIVEHYGLPDGNNPEYLSIPRPDAQGTLDDGFDVTDIIESIETTMPTHQFRFVYRKTMGWSAVVENVEYWGPYKLQYRQQLLDGTWSNWLDAQITYGENPVERRYEGAAGWVAPTTPVNFFENTVLAHKKILHRFKSTALGSIEWKYNVFGSAGWVDPR